MDIELSAALSAYDLVPPLKTFALSQGKNNTAIGVQTGAGTFVWRSYTQSHTPPSIAYEHQLLTWLTQAGLSFAVPHPVPMRDGALLYTGVDIQRALLSWLPGTRLEASDPAHAELLGAAAGELQTALNQFKPTPRPGRNLFGRFFDFPLAYDPRTLAPSHLGLPDTPPYTTLLAWWRDEAAELDAFVTGDYQSLPHQICHNDLTPANVLVDAGRVVAVLDFEFAAPAARALDVAMCLRMTMQVWENPEPWETVRHFMRGYTRWIALTEQEILALPMLLRLRSTSSIVWWLAHLAGPPERDRIIKGIQYQQNLQRWLALYSGRFVDVLQQAAHS